MSPLNDAPHIRDLPTAGIAVVGKRKPQHGVGEATGGSTVVRLEDGWDRKLRLGIVPRTAHRIIRKNATSEWSINEPCVTTWGIGG